MNTYVTYYSIKIGSEELRFAYEVTGVKRLLTFIRYQIQHESAFNFVVYRINNLDDRDDRTRMYNYELA